MRWKAILLAQTALAVFGLGNPALAQSTDAATETKSANFSINDIIVTAQRQAENSQRAAVPLNVVGGGELLSAGVTKVESLTNLTPALSIQPSSTGNLIFLRGVGNFTVEANSDPAIAFNYDGVYVGRPTSTTGVFYDLERVEILKGPQGTLYGRNATGGAINILPAQPKIGEFSGYASVSYGNYDALNAEGAINAPLGDRGAMRLSLSRSVHDGYLSDGTSDDDSFAGRLQLKAELTPELTVRVAFDYAQNRGMGSGNDYRGIYLGGVNGFIPSGIELGSGALSPESQAYRQAVVFPPLGNHLPAQPRPYQNNEFYGANAEIQYDMDIGTVTVIPAWRNARLDFLGIPGAITYYKREESTQFSVEARFVGKRLGPVDYQFGVYFYDETIKSDNQLTAGNVGNTQNPVYDTKSYAGFGRATLHLSDRLRLVGGLRYTQDNKKYNNDLLNSVIVCTVFVNGIPSCPDAPTVPLFRDPSQLPYPFPSTNGAIPIFANGIPTGVLSIRDQTVWTDETLKSNKLTYRAAVEVDVAERSMLYASVESGYRSGGFSPAFGFETYKPETIVAYTLGMKNRFLDNKLQLNIEGFWWDYKEQQINTIGLDASGRTANYTQNIGAARIKGVEVDGKLLVTPTTMISADIQYLDAKQRDFTYLQGPGAPPLTGCAINAVAGASPYEVDCSGQPSYNSPKWTINLAGDQTIDLGDYQIRLSADTQYRSSRYVGFNYLREQKVGSSWTTNAQVQFGPANESWSISAYVRNIENERISIYSSSGAGADVLTDVTTPPRTYGVRMAAKF